MKKIIILLFLLIFTININAQISGCNFVPTPDYFDSSKFSNRNVSIPDDGRKFVLNVKFHYIIGLNNENQYNLSEDKMLAAIAMMNIEFNSIGVFFKYRGTDFLSASNYIVPGPNPSFTHAAVVALFANQNLIMDNAINVYVADGVGTSAGNGKLWLAPSVFQNATPYKWGLLHETGHLLGLLHTFSDQGELNYENLTTNRPSCHVFLFSDTNLNVLKKPTFPLLPLGVGVEAVTRDPLNPFYNADNEGDWVTDTDAIFTEHRNNHCRDEYISYNNPTFTPTPLGFTTEYLNWIEDPRVVDYTGDSTTSVFYCFSTFTKYSYTVGNTFYTTATNGVDQTSNNIVTTTVALGSNTWQNIVATLLVNCTAVGSGETYKCDNNLVYNYMGIYYNAQRSKFTPGQKQRIREKLLGNFVSTNNDIFYALALNTDGTPDILVLYQPFQASKTITSIASTTDNGNGTATVCRNYVSSGFRFQPGFDYEFPENIAPDLNAYTTAQTPLIAAPAFNCPVKILQLSNNLGEAPTVCRGVDCVIEPLRRGTLYSTQVLGSMNITVEELDAIEVKDPDLYNNLMSQYYYILKKETSSGAKLQEVFYKN